MPDRNDQQYKDYQPNNTNNRLSKGTANSHHSFARRPEASGRGKQILLLVALLVVMFLIVSDKLQRRTPSQPSQALEQSETESESEAQQDEVALVAGGVMIKADASGHFRGKLLINDVQMPFLIDTGATQTVIPESLAISAELPIGRNVQTNTAGGLVTNHLTRLSTMKLGNAELKNLQAIINPHLDEVLIGMNTLKYFQMTQNKDTLTLIASNDAEQVETLEKDLPLQMPPPQFMADVPTGSAITAPVEDEPKVAKSWKKTMICDANKHCRPSYGYH